MSVRVMKLVPAFGWGGTERQFVNLGLGLDASRCSVVFGCLRRFGLMLDEIVQRRIPVVDYNVVSLRDLRVLRAQWRLARDLRNLGIDIVHTYGLHASMFAFAPAKLAGARFVVSVRDMGVYLSPAQRLAQRWICRLADHVLVNATAIKQWLVESGCDGEKITMIPNGIDVARFERKGGAQLREEFGLPADAPLVAVVGRVARMKGIEHFLAAASMVAPGFPAARFLVIGEPSFTARGAHISVDGSYEEELVQLAVKLGIRDRVIFTGFRRDVGQILPQITVSVLPSLSEGLSNTLLESMAAGVPTVATQVGGAAEVIRDGENALLVGPADPAALSDAICRILESPSFADRIGAAARQHIAQNYSTEQMVERTTRFYESIHALHSRINHERGQARAAGARLG